MYRIIKHYAQAHIIRSMRKGVAHLRTQNWVGVGWGALGFFFKQKYNEPHYKAEPNKIVIFVIHNI